MCRRNYERERRHSSSFINFPSFHSIPYMSNLLISLHYPFITFNSLISPSRFQITLTSSFPLVKITLSLHFHPFTLYFTPFHRHFPLKIIPPLLISIFPYKPTKPPYPKFKRLNISGPLKTLPITL